MVRVRVVTPVPLHSSHGCSMIEPLPRHSVHGSENPNAPWLRLIDARAVAVRADLRAGARPRAAAVAVGARRRAGEPQRHRDALGGLQERRARFRSPGRCRDAAGSAAAVVRRGRTARRTGRRCWRRRSGGPRRTGRQVELGTVAAEAAEVTAAAALKRPRPKPPSANSLRVSSYSLRLAVVRQHVLGLRDGLVPLLGRRVVRVAVGMHLGQQLAGGPLDLVGRWRQRRRRAPCRSPSQPILVGPCRVTSSPSSMLCLVV